MVTLFLSWTRNDHPESIEGKGKWTKTIKYMDSNGRRIRRRIGSCNNVPVPNVMYQR